MSSYRVRKQRWLSRLKQKKRRHTAFFLEQRVKALEEQKEIDAVDSEQIHDLLNQLEIKIHKLSDDLKITRYRFAIAEAKVEQRSWWFKLKQFLG